MTALEALKDLNGMLAVAGFILKADDEIRYCGCVQDFAHMLGQTLKD